MGVSGLGSGLAIGREASYNDGTSEVDVQLPFTAETLEVPPNFIVSETLSAGNLVQSMDDRRQGTTAVAGTTDGLLTTVGCELLFDAGLGGYSFAAGAGAPERNTHTFTPDNLRSYVVRKQIGDTPATGNPWVSTYRGMIAERLGMAIALDENVTWSEGWIGTDEVMTNDGTVPLGGTTPTGVQTYSAVDAAVVIGGDPNYCVQSVDWEIDNSVEARYCLGQLSLTKQPDRTNFVNISGSFTVEHEHNKRTLYDAYRSGASVQLVVTLALNPAAPSNPDTITITINAALDGESQKIPGTAILERTVPFMGLRPSAADPDSAAITVEVKSLADDLGA